MQLKNVTVLQFRGGLFLVYFQSVNRVITCLATLHPPQIIITLPAAVDKFLDHFPSPRIFQLIEAFVKPGENFIRSKPSLGELVTFSPVSDTVPKKD